MSSSSKPNNNNNNTNSNNNNSNSNNNHIPLSKQESFQYWKQKDNESSVTSSSSSSPSTPVTSQSPVIQGLSKSSSASSLGIGSTKTSSINQNKTVATTTTATSTSSPKKSVSSLSLNNTSGSTSPAMRSSPSNNSSTATTTTTTKSNSDYSKNVLTTGKQTSSSSSGSTASPSKANISQTLPSLRMKPERKSIKTIFLDLWSKPQEEANNNNGTDSQPPQEGTTSSSSTSTSSVTPPPPTTTTTTTTTTTEPVNKTTSSTTTTTMDKPTAPTTAKSKGVTSTPTKSIPTPTNSILKSSSKSSPLLKGGDKDVGVLSTSAPSSTPTKKTGALTKPTTTTTTTSSSSNTTIKKPTVSPNYPPTTTVVAIPPPVPTTTNTSSNNNTAAVKPSSTNNITSNDQQQQKVFITNSTTTTMDSNTNSSSSTSSYNGNGNGDEDINKYKKKEGEYKTEAERLSTLEFTVTLIKKQYDDMVSKLIIETNLRKELESHCDELEARLALSESRLHRYSTIQPLPAPAQKQQEDDEENEIKEIQRVRDDQRINSLLLQIKTLEDKVHALETTNSKLCEEIHTISFEHSIFTSEKKKKALKKLEQREKEIQKEREQKEKELQKEKMKTLKREKEKMKEEGRERSLTGSYDQNSLTDSDSDKKMSALKKQSSSTSELISISAASSSSASNSPALVSSSPKKVGFIEETINHTSKSKSQGYGNTIKKWAGKRMSAHIMGLGSSSSSNVSDVESQSSPSPVDKTKPTEEKSQLVKGYFNQYYDGDVDELKNQKMTRMRSKSLSRDSVEDEEDFSPKISVTGSLSSSTNAAPIPKEVIQTPEKPSNEDKKKGYSTIGRMFGGGAKKESNANKLTLSPVDPDGKLSFLLNERLNHRISRDELIFKKIMKAESIFGITLSEDTLERIQRYINNSADALIDYNHLGDLFTKPVEESQVKSLKESIEQSVLSNFSQKDPYLVASTLLFFFESLPEKLLTRISNGLISTANIEDLVHRRSLVRSLLYSLPPSHRSVLKSILQLIRDLSDIEYSVTQTDEDKQSNVIPFSLNQPGIVEESASASSLLSSSEDATNSLSIDDFSPIGGSINSSPLLVGQQQQQQEGQQDVKEEDQKYDEQEYATEEGGEYEGGEYNEPVIEEVKPKVKKIPPPLPPRQPITANNTVVGSPFTSPVSLAKFKRQPAKSQLGIHSMATTFAPLLIISPTSSNEGSIKALTQLIEDYDNIFDGQVDIQFIIKENLSLVKCASFDKVFERLIDLNNRDTDYNYTIFYSYDYYSKSNEFLDKIVHYYKKTTTTYNDSTSISTLQIQSSWQMELSLTVLSVAMFWMKLHHNNLSSDLLFLSKLKTFMESAQPVPPAQSTFFAYFKTFFQSSNTPIKHLYERGDSFYNNSKNKGKTMKSSDLKIKDGPVNIYDIGAQDMATQITIVDNELLMSIPLFQFLHKAFTKPELSPQFQNMVSKFNEWAKWTSYEILSKEKLNDRVTAMSYFIDLAKHSVEMGNFNAAAAIVGGLNHSSISRLRHTWEKLPTKVQQDYKQLETLYDMSMNYKNYREALKASTEAKVKVIPYLALFPKDLIAIEEANDTYTSGGLINIEKFRLLYRIIKEIQGYQQPLFNTRTSEPIKNYLLNISKDLLDEKELHSLSLKVEPRQQQ